MTIFELQRAVEGVLERLHLTPAETREVSMTLAKLAERYASEQIAAERDHGLELIASLLKGMDGKLDKALAQSADAEALAISAARAAGVR